MKRLASIMATTIAVSVCAAYLPAASAAGTGKVTLIQTYAAMR